MAFLCGGYPDHCKGDFTFAHKVNYTIDLRAMPTVQANVDPGAKVVRVDIEVASLVKCQEVLLGL